MSDSTPSEQCNALMNKYSPLIARSMLVQSTAQALANAAHNATFAQQQHNVIINANTSTGAGILQAIGASFAK